MRISIRDGLATLFVAAAALVYALWATGAALSDWSPRETAAVVFTLGFVTCMTDQKQMAVVYGAARGKRPPITYVVLVSALGAAALVTGILALVIGSTALVATLTALVVGMWVAATARHALTPETGRSPGRPARTA